MITKEKLAEATAYYNRNRDMIDRLIRSTKMPTEPSSFAHVSRWCGENWRWFVVLSHRTGCKTSPAKAHHDNSFLDFDVSDSAVDAFASVGCC